MADHCRPRNNQIGGSDAERQADDDGEYMPQSHLPSTSRVRRSPVTRLPIARPAVQRRAYASPTGTGNRPSGLHKDHDERRPDERAPVLEAATRLRHLRRSLPLIRCCLRNTVGSTISRGRRQGMRRVALAVVVLGGVVALGGATAGAGRKAGPGLAVVGHMNHIVVIYEENHSFDNLYGGWEGVNGRPATPVKQLNANGVAFTCLMQQDVNLTSPPQPGDCTDTTTGTSFTTHFPNQPFGIDAVIPPTATTCPRPGVFAANGVTPSAGVAGGCTRDIVHRFYQEQFQLDNGKMDRYVLGSDATGLAMGYYETKALPIYKYLHVAGHPRYAIADDMFQAAFGGSFLNHQWLVAAATPVWANAPNDGGANDLHSVVDGNGMPTSYPLYTSGI